MLAFIAFIVFLVAWAVHVLGDGLTDPWAWIFAGLALLALEVAFHERIARWGPWRN